MEWVLAAVALVVGLYLVTRRWVWVLAFGLGALASAFTVLACIVHFQILAAVGFAILTAILHLAYTVALAGYD
jgi:hypothetical protein